MARLIVAGGRDFTDKELAFEEIDAADKLLGIYKIVAGGARGADLLGEEWALLRESPVERFNPNWDGLGRSAGFARNEEMAIYADALLAFWDGKSKGTKHMIDTAIRKGLWTKVVRYEQG